MMGHRNLLVVIVKLLLCKIHGMNTKMNRYTYLLNMDRINMESMNFLKLYRLMNKWLMYL